MKTLILFFLFVSCLGQYPKLRIDERGRVYNANAPLRTSYIHNGYNDDEQTQNDSIPVKADSIILFNKNVDERDIEKEAAEDAGFYRQIAPTQTGSSKFYWKKYTYYQNKMNIELEKINRTQAKKVTSNLFRYQDSAKRYYDLLQKVKNK